MSTSSDAGSLFDGVSWQNLVTLLRIVRQSTLRSESLVARRFRETATNFISTKAFLVRTRVLSLQGDAIDIVLGLPDERNAQINAVLRHLMARDQLSVTYELLEYLRGFELVEGALLRRGDLPDVGKHSSLRNFLMEAGVVVRGVAEQTYLLVPDYAWLYVIACTRGRPVSPSQLKLSVDAKSELGTVAEMKVVEWERRRLGAEHAFRVEHIAAVDTSAGFDVLSATTDGKEILQRFIEVKAVPAQTMRFYWTRNEVAVAKTLGSLYYLYLVPVTSHGIPEVDEMNIIADPCSTVLCSDNWKIEAEVLKCEILNKSEKARVKDE